MKSNSQGSLTMSSTSVDSRGSLLLQHTLRLVPSGHLHHSPYIHLWGGHSLPLNRTCRPHLARYNDGVAVVRQGGVGVDGVPLRVVVVHQREMICCKRHTNTGFEERFSGGLDSELSPA